MPWGEPAQEQPLLHRVIWSTPQIPLQAGASKIETTEVQGPSLTTSDGSLFCASRSQRKAPPRLGGAQSSHGDLSWLTHRETNNHTSHPPQNLRRGSHTPRKGANKMRRPELEATGRRKSHHLSPEG